MDKKRKDLSDQYKLATVQMGSDQTGPSNGTKIYPEPKPMRAAPRMEMPQWS